MKLMTLFLASLGLFASVYGRADELPINTVIHGQDRIFQVLTNSYANLNDMNCAQKVILGSKIHLARISSGYVLSTISTNGSCFDEVTGTSGVPIAAGYTGTSGAEIDAIFLGCCPVRVN